MLSAFPPVVGRRSVILILGTMPGPESLAREEYYGHPRNQFWPLLSAVLGEKPATRYAGRVRFVRRRRIALWDVVERCERQGSADSSIRNERVNDIPAFLRRYPRIRHVFFDGKSAAALYGRHFDPVPGIGYTVLPSSSPRHTMPVGRKAREWSRIREILSQLLYNEDKQVLGPRPRAGRRRKRREQHERP